MKKIISSIRPIYKSIITLYKKYKEIINYLIVGGLTTIVSILSYIIFKLIITNYITCTVLSWIAAVLFAYFANRIFVFNSKNKNKIKECINFISCRLLTLGIEIAVMFLFVDLIKIPDLISKISVQFIIVVLNYIFSKLLVFKEKTKRK